MKTYRVIKALNHNVVQVVTRTNEEIIIFGKGIGFNCKKDEMINPEVVEKEYYFRDPKNTDLYANLVAICDERL